MDDPSLCEREGVAAADEAAPSLAGMRQAIEALYFAYRDFTRDADEELAQYGFGRAHHRVIYFVGRHPGMTVSDLLALLRITKQSLAPVLAQLVEDGFVVQRADDGDRRRRRLFLSAEAQDLERLLTEKQARRLDVAFRAAGEGSAEGFVRVLQAMVDGEDPPGNGR
ncbi:MAG: MarR family transcriptional regulator [Rhodospirillales bacterium]